MKSIFPVLAIIAALSPVLAGAKEILIHSGPPVATPDATAYSPVPGAEEAGKDLTFIYEFFIGWEILEKLPQENSGSEPLPADKAIELASKSAEVAERETPFPVRKLELLTYDASSKRISYYFITLQTDGSAETHRVVLMDGTVVKPKLRRTSK